MKNYTKTYAVNVWMILRWKEQCNTARFSREVKLEFTPHILETQDEWIYYLQSSTCRQGRALPVYATKEYKRNEYIALFFLNVGSGLLPVSRPRPLNQRAQISLYSLNWRWGSPHNRTTSFGENIDPLSLLKFEPRVVYPAAQSLYYARYPGTTLDQRLELHFYHKNNGTRESWTGNTTSSRITAEVGVGVREYDNKPLGCTERWLMSRIF
jgi:hypothetical protein